MANSMEDKDENVKKDLENDSDDSRDQEKNSIGQKIADGFEDQEKDDAESEKNNELKFFERKKDGNHFSIWNADQWLDEKFKGLNCILKFFLETLIICIIFLIPSCFYLKANYKEISLKDIYSKGSNGGSEFIFKFSIFVITCSIFERFISLIDDHLFNIIGFMLKILNLLESELLWSMIDNLKSSSYYLKNSILFWFIFRISTKMFGKMESPNILNILKLDSIHATILTASVYMGLMFTMKFILYIFIYDIKRGSYSDKIKDLNNKTFIYRKLKEISEADPGYVDYLVEDIAHGYDPGFYLIDRDFFVSIPDSEIVAQNIMVLLKVKHFTYSDIGRYFPDDQDKVFKYLGNFEKINPEKKISAEAFKVTAKELYQNVVKMGKSIKYRNSIFDKLELIFSFIIKYITAIFACYIFKIDYKIYLTSFGTTFVTFSWIFADTIKKVFNCFVFVLIIRPYDIGDKVFLENNVFEVHRIDLLTSTFLTSLKKIVYISNEKLINTIIYNYERSPPQSFQLLLLVDEATTYSMADSVCDDLKPKIKKHSNDFTNIKLSSLIDGELRFTIATTQNFQNGDLTSSRERKLINLFESGLKKKGIVYKNSFKFIK